MWWECSECGGHIERARPPVVCRECGTAGAIFVPAELDEPMASHPEAESPRAAWLRIGLDRAHAAARA